MNAPKDLSKEKVDVLKRMCKERGLSGYSKLKKSELIDLLNSSIVAQESASASSSQPNEAHANSSTIDSSMTPHHIPSIVPSRHSDSNPGPSSSAPSVASSTFPQASELGDPTNPSYLVQSSLSVDPVQVFETLHTRDRGPDAEAASFPERLSEPQVLIVNPTPNRILGHENHTISLSLKAPGHTIEPDGTVYGFSTPQSSNSNPIAASTPLKSESFRAKSGQPFSAGKQSRLSPRSADHEGPRAKRQKVLSEGRGEEVSAEQELLDSQLMPPPQLPRLGPGYAPLQTGTNISAYLTLSKSTCVSQQREDDAFTDDCVPPSATIVEVARRTLTGDSLPPLSTHPPISEHVRSSHSKNSALISIKPLVFKEPKRLGLGGILSGKDVRNQSISCASSHSIVGHMDTVQVTRESYENSFLSQFFSSPLVGFSPLADQLWSNADHPLQTAVALRFVLSRLFFALGCGMVQQWSMNQVVDARPLGKSQDIWKIETQDHRTKLPDQTAFYILSFTGEVIGRPPENGSPDAGLSAVIDLPIRGDWSAFIKNHLPNNSVENPSPTLFSLVRWQNAEEYEHGISKAWLNRLASDPDALSKIQAAQRYIMANVVSNSVSGRYMTPVQMAQDLNGCLDPQERFSSTIRSGGKYEVNMFVAMSNYVESVHFQARRLAYQPSGCLSTASYVEFHPAIASVQTPAREVYILRDTGQEIGTEEEGICATWMDLLGCDARGFSVAAVGGRGSKYSVVALS